MLNDIFLVLLGRFMHLRGIRFRRILLLMSNPELKYGRKVSNSGTSTITAARNLPLRDVLTLHQGYEALLYQ